MSNVAPTAPERSDSISTSPATAAPEAAPVSPISTVQSLPKIRRFDARCGLFVFDRHMQGRRLRASQPCHENMLSISSQAGEPTCEEPELLSGGGVISITLGAARA